MVQVVGLDPGLDHGPHQGLQRLRLVVDPGQQHGLSEHRDAGVHQAGAGGAGGGRQLAGVVGVKGDVDRLARALEGFPERLADRIGIDRRDAGVQADDLHMVDAAQPLHDRAEPARREHQRIAAGEDHLPDLRVGGDVAEGNLQRLGRQWLAGHGPDHLAAEAEAAVDGAGVGRLQEHAVRIAVHDPGDRALGLIADRIGQLAGQDLELGLGGDELARDRIGRV